MNDETVLVMRSVSAGMVSRNGFRWPTEGPVECDDWSPVAECGQGLHGLLWGAGDASLMSYATGTQYLAVRVLSADTVNLGGKAKFQRGIVERCGELGDIAKYIHDNGAPVGTPIVGITLTAHGGNSTLTAGGNSTLTAHGWNSTLTAGWNSVFNIPFWDGKSWRRRVAIVGENDIKPDVPYRLNDAGEFEEVAR